VSFNRFEPKENSMRTARTNLLPSLFIAALVLVLPLASYPQSREKFVISARAGGVNAVTGRASMRAHGNSEWRQLTIKEDLEAGDVVRTGLDGRVEMLLNPGSYMRLGENSEFELADNSLENLEIRLVRGTAIVEVTGADDEELLIGITTPHTRMSIVRRGLYRVNVVPGDNTELIVRKGRVMLEGSHTKVKGGNKVVFSSNSVSVAKLDNADKKGWDTFESWSKDRAQTLATENSKISSRTLNAFANSFGSDWSYLSRSGRSGFWLYSSRARCYTFVPYYGSWDSPYGGGYSRSFFSGSFGYWPGRQIFGGSVGPTFGNGNPLGGASTGSGSGSSGTATYNPSSSSGARIADSPMTGHGKPDLSPGGPGMKSPNQQ
jgi:FecR protein